MKINRTHFLEAIDLLDGIPLTTIKKRRPFLVKRIDDDICYIPLSTGKPRVQRNTWLERLIVKWNASESLKPVDYNESVHGSYFLAIINYIIGIRSEAEKTFNFTGLDDSFHETVGIAKREYRIGQELFRRKLLHFWSGGTIEEISNPDLLIASHIKPWSSSTSSERLDVYNGFLLSPNLDRLFDLGYISFDDSGEVLISSALDKKHSEIFGMENPLRLKQIDDQHRVYLQYHREYKFEKRQLWTDTVAPGFVLSASPS